MRGHIGTMPKDILPDLLRPGLRAVFCGTAAGAMSAATGSYYARPGNRFWTTLHGCGLTPRLFAPSEFLLLDDLGIGLTDVAKHASGQDADRHRMTGTAAGSSRRWRPHAPEVLAFTGKKAASMATGIPVRLIPYGPWDAPGLPPLWVLPSPSGAACRSWDRAPWLALAASLPRTTTLV